MALSTKIGGNACCLNLRVTKRGLFAAKRRVDTLLREGNSSVQRRCMQCAGACRRDPAETLYKFCYEIGDNVAVCRGSGYTKAAASKSPC